MTFEFTFEHFMIIVVAVIVAILVYKLALEKLLNL
jgi:hypothetical protein